MLRLIYALRRRRRQKSEQPTTTYPARPTAAEWRALIAEFEERASQKYSSSISGRRALLPPPGSTPGKRNEAQFASLPYVECSFMAAWTTALWFIGRMLKMDALVMLLYPLPTMYVAARWGLGFSDLTLYAVTFLIFTLMGPLYAQGYLFNSGLLTWTYARCLWWRWSFGPTLAAGAFAKGIGLMIQLAWASVVLRYNAWIAVTFQVRQMIEALCGIVNKVFGRSVWASPGFRQVQIGIVIVVALHSVYHVFFTLVSSSILLKSIEGRHRIARRPPDVPGVKWLIKRARDSPKRHDE